MYHVHWESVKQRVHTVVAVAHEGTGTGTKGTQKSLRPGEGRGAKGGRGAGEGDEYRSHACALRSAISQAAGRRGWPQLPATFGPRYDSV